MNNLVLSEIINEEEERLFFHWNETQHNFNITRCIHQMFEDIVRKIPHEIALIYQNEKLTFDELNKRANRFAHFLLTKGVGPGCYHESGN
jgi:non-ribosomal peptide synthetase component F